MSAGNSRNAGGTSWEIERTSVTVSNAPRPRSNKFSKSDFTRKPRTGERERVWVGGYKKKNGTEVHGYYRTIG